MPWYKWSRVSNSNAGSDSTINWAEGQSPSTINDSARAMMSATAMYRDDIAGAIVTAGTSTAYTVSSFSQFDTLADMNGQQIWFTPHVTNGATVTLNVDGLGAKPLRSAPNTELPAGVIIQGTPYGAIYNSTDGAFYLKGYFGSPYLIPLAGGLDYWGTTAPNSSFVFPIGQAISRTTYAALFALTGTTYGTGDGSTTFNLPDCRGRVVAGKDNMGGTGAGRLQAANGGLDGTVLGNAGGADTETLTLAQLPTGITSSGPLSSADVIEKANTTGFALNSYSFNGGGTTVIQAFGNGAVISQGSLSGSVASTSNNTGSQAVGGAKNVPTVQPTIICNYIIRII